MDDRSTDEMSTSWCVVERNGSDEDAAVEVTAASLGGRDSPDQAGEAPISLLLAGETDSSGLPSPVATPSDGLDMSDSGSSQGGEASSDHSDFEVFDQEAEREKEEQEERKEEAAVVSHEERLRLALDNLRADARPAAALNRQPSPLALEPAIQAAPLSPALRQVAEPPRVQIIRHNADEESLPESDIQLEDAEETDPVANDHLELLADGQRVRRYQHLPNSNLNARLNSLVMCALLFVIGLAVGHFIGSTHERFSQHFQRVDCLDRMKSIQGELLRCAQKYDEVELQLNDMKATLVQKEYVDKWESLYQEGEEEKATLTETLNLYRNRYNKQQQLLEERLDRLKGVQNELLRCTHRYEQLELKQNEVKATHVQKEYVDKWESLYQEGEEEKAAITATMNLYKTRYNKQKQLLTQCEVRFQDVKEQMNKLKLQKGGCRDLPVMDEAQLPSAAQQDCERRTAALTGLVSALESQLRNCTAQLPQAGLLRQLLLFLSPFNATGGAGDSWLWPRDLSYLAGTGDRLSNSTRQLLAHLQQHFNLTGNFSQATGDWLNAAFVSTNHSERFAEWLTKMRASVDRFEVADLLRRASVAVADNVEQFFHLLSAAMRSVETGGKEETAEQATVEKQSLYQRVAEKLNVLRAAYAAKKEEHESSGGAGMDKISAAWRKALSSTQTAWNVGVKRAKDVLDRLRAERKAEATPGQEEAKPDVPAKRKLASVDPHELSAPSPVVLTAENKSEPTNNRSAAPSWFTRRAEARKRLHRSAPDAGWYWRRKREGRKRRSAKRGRVFDRMSEVEPEEWPQAFWFMQRHMRRAQQRVWKSLSNLHERLLLHQWMLRRKRLREKERKKAAKERRREEEWF